MSKASELTIRDATVAERSTTVALTRDAYAEFARVMDPVAWEELRDAIDDALASDAPRERIVAEFDGRIVGSVALFPPETKPYAEFDGISTSPELRLLAVSRSARGLGVGSALVDECVRRARRMGASEIGLHTSRSMQAAIQLYRSMGFERVPERDFTPPGAELVEGYAKPLV